MLPLCSTPSLPQKAMNFIQAVAGHVAAGCPTVSAIEHRRRLDICTGGNGNPVCPHYKDYHCKACGCLLYEKTKWKEQRCPVGKW
jgi:hypothetical protein